MSPELRIAFWEIVTRKITKKEELFSYEYLSPSDKEILNKHFKRKYNTRIAVRKGNLSKGYDLLRSEFFKQVAKRGPIKEAVRKYKRYALIWEDYKNNLEFEAVRMVGKGGRLGQTQLRDQSILIGRILNDQEDRVVSQAQYLIEEDRRTKLGKRCEQLPMFACSGELEADAMKADKIAKLARYNGQPNRVTYSWKHSEMLDFGQDGGGQAETRFLIEGKFPEIVEKCVRTIGSPEKNGGHIHINCQGREDIAEKVFMSFRYHLSWFRWLVPPVRRHHRWAAVERVPSNWYDAKQQKAAAISGNTFYRTGTVEIRLWPTSQLASEWRGRAALMKAMAWWAMEYPPTVARDITKETGEAAWTQFFVWASRNHPEGLRYALRVLRRKGQSSTSDADREACAHLYKLFTDSGITVAGFRRRNNTTSDTKKENDNV